MRKASTELLEQGIQVHPLLQTSSPLNINRELTLRLEPRTGARQAVNTISGGAPATRNLSEAPTCGQQAVRYQRESKEVLATHGHRNSPEHNPQFPRLHEVDTQSLF